jgi:hypothetical protein
MDWASARRQFDGIGAESVKKILTWRLRCLTIGESWASTGGAVPVAASIPE